MKKFSELFEFIDKAEKSRKYPQNTADGLRTALKLFETHLNDEELNSLDKFKENLGQIHQTIFNKNKNFTAGSLAAYKSRVGKVLGDYEKYGSDPVKMNSWTPKIVTRTKKALPKSTSTNNPSDSPFTSASLNDSVGSHRIELSLRPDAKALIMVPQDISKPEAERIKTLIDSLVQ